MSRVKQSFETNKFLNASVVIEVEVRQNSTWRQGDTPSPVLGKTSVEINTPVDLASGNGLQKLLQNALVEAVKNWYEANADWLKEQSDAEALTE